MNEVTMIVPLEQSGADLKPSSQVHLFGPVQIPWFAQLFNSSQDTVPDESANVNNQCISEFWITS